LALFVFLFTLYSLHFHCFYIFVPGVQSAGCLDIHFTVGTSYERAAPLAEKNAAAGLSDFSYVVPRGGIFLGKWRSTFAGSSDGKMNVQSACALISVTCCDYSEHSFLILVPVFYLSFVTRSQNVVNL
jgi:hypothetical protein